MHFKNNMHSVQMIYSTTHCEDKVMVLRTVMVFPSLLLTMVPTDAISFLFCYFLWYKSPRAVRMCAITRWIKWNFINVSISFFHMLAYLFLQPVWLGSFLASIAFVMLHELICKHEILLKAESYNKNRRKFFVFTWDYNTQNSSFVLSDCNLKAIGNHSCYFSTRNEFLPTVDRNSCQAH